MNKDRQKTNVERELDNEDYNLLLWERKTNVDYVEVRYEQPDFYVNEEDSFCLLSFNQTHFFTKKTEKGIENIESTEGCDIFFEIKEEVIEFVEGLLKKLKDNLINPSDYDLEK